MNHPEAAQAWLEKVYLKHEHQLPNQINGMDKDVWFSGLLQSVVMRDMTPSYVTDWILTLAESETSQAELEM